MSKLIPLSQGKVTLVDAVDYESLARWKWYAARYGKTWYALQNVRVGGKSRTISMHRQILGSPSGLQVDHVNHDGLDNRRSNLRTCTHQQNKFNNGSRRHTSVYRGVCFDKTHGRWRATIARCGKGWFLGHWDSEEDAALDYNVAAQMLFGQYAHLNPV